MSRRTLRRLAWLGTLSIVLLLAADVMARGGRGGGGFARGGGGFSRGGGGGHAGYGGGGRPTPNVSRSGPSTGGSFGRGAYGVPGGAELGGIPAERRDALGRDPGGFDQPPMKLPTQPSAIGDGAQERTQRELDRLEDRDPRRDERLEQRQDVRKERKEHYEDHTYSYEEYYEDRWGYTVGVILTATAFRNLSCTPSTVVVGGVTYYRCDNAWYTRSYGRGNVTYMVVNPPPGY